MKRKPARFSLKEQDRIINNIFPRMRERCLRLIKKHRPAWDIDKVRPEILSKEVIDKLQPTPIYPTEILECKTIEEAHEVARYPRDMELVCRNWHDLWSVNDLIKSRFLPTGHMYGLFDETPEGVKKGGGNG